MKYLVILVIIVVALAVWATWRASRKQKVAKPVKTEVLQNQPSRSAYSSNYATDSKFREVSAPKSNSSRGAREVKPYRAKTSKPYAGVDEEYVSDNWGYGYPDIIARSYRDSDSSSGDSGSSYSSYDSGSSSSDSGSSGGSSSSSYDSGSSSSSGGSSSSD